MWQREKGATTSMVACGLQYDTSVGRNRTLTHNRLVEAIGRVRRGLLIRIDNA